MERWPSRPPPGTSFSLPEEIVFHTEETPREAQVVPIPDGLHPKVAEALERRGLTSLYTHQAEAFAAAERGEHVIVSTGTASGKDARVQPAGAELARRAAEEPRALPLSDQGARAGPGALDRHARRPQDPRRDLRRRHALGAALADPQVGERRAHEPGHAPHRRAAPPRPLGRRALEPALRRRRRGARLPRRVRLARWKRPAAVAAGGGDLRRRATVPPRLGHDREPRRTGRGADRARRTRGLEGRGRARGADGRVLESADPRRGDGPAREPARRGGADPRHARLRRDSGRSASRRAARLRSSSTGSRASGSTRRPRRDSRRTAPATRPSSAARSSGGSSRASCSASPPRTRSSWGSTSGRSTARSRSASRGRSRACASSGAAPGASGTGSPSWSPPRTRSTSSSCASRSCS